MKLRLAWLLAALIFAAPAFAREIRPLEFSRGASSAVVSDAVVRGTRSVYSFEARKGQWATIVVTAVESNAAISVWRPGAKATFGEFVEIDGRALAGAGELDEAKKWQGRLPDTGTYLIVVGPTRGNATFELSLAISKLPPPAKAGSAATPCTSAGCGQPTDGPLEKDGGMCLGLHALAD